MEFKKNKPIYLQISDGLCERIVEGEWKEGERIVSIRDYATEMGVNPNTVQRAYDMLQQEGVIFNRRGLGYFVSEDAKHHILEVQRKDFMENDVPEFLQKMELLGLTPKDIFKE